MGTTADKLNGIVSSKEAIRQAIVSKGVDCDTTVPLAEYAGKIGSISGGFKWPEDTSKTYLWVEINPSSSILGLRLNFAYYGEPAVISIDWGDGNISEHNINSGTKYVLYNYADYGKYTIVISVISGKLVLGSGTTSTAFVKDSANITSSILRRIFIGDNIYCNQYAFYSNVSLREVRVSSKVNLLASAFNNNNGCDTYIFDAVTPPPLITVDAFANIQLYTKIYVPDDKVANYKGAIYWRNVANYIYPVSEYNT
jgi:hypothetical protein